MSAALRPVPDIDSERFWRGLKTHRIEIQCCDACGTLRFPPRPVCPRDRATGTTWVACSGAGILISSVVTHRAFHPALVTRVPYALLLVQLVEQPDLLVYGNYLSDLRQLQPGLELDAVFDDIDDEITLLQWRPRK
jgi:uncharacterized OB-fold protein